MDKKLAFQIKILMAGRVIIVTLFLGSLFFFQTRFGYFPSPSYIRWLIAAIYGLTLLYAILFPYVTKPRPFAVLQILGDLGIEAGIVFATGGAESPFSFLFLLSIISSSILISRTGGYMVSAGAALLYGALALLEFYQGGESLAHGEVFLLHTIFLNISAFFLVGFLSGHLTEGLRRTRKELEKRTAAWDELQAFHQHIVTNMDSGLFTTDLSGGITSFNQAAVRITGHSPGEVLGARCSQLFDCPPLRDLFRKPLDPERPQHIPHRWDGPFPDKGGRELYLNMNLSLLKDEKGRIKGLIGVFHDLTERKEMEEQVRRADRLAAVGRMAAGMAHEIRNPLAAISGSIQLLKTELAVEETQQRLMDIVIREIERLDRLITDFLDYARPHPPSFQTCDVHQLLDETLLLVENSPGKRPPPQVVKSFDLRHGSIFADLHQMKQVFWNLCRNALESMPSGGTLTLSTRLLEPPYHPNVRLPSRHHPTESAPAKWMEISLSDTGTGICARDKGRIFDPFYTAKNNGNGFGLAIVQRIIEEHRGAIEVESEVGKGTTFKIVLPASKG